MSEQIKNGGPAFPAKVSVDRDTGDAVPYQFGNNDFCVGGMTLRDYFAAKASEDDVQFHIHHHFNNGRDMKLFPNQGGVRDRTREQARYQYADAMLRARELSNGRK